MPGFRGKSAQAGEDRVSEYAQGHRAHPANLVAKPPEQHAARGRADEEHRDDGAEPFGSVRRGGRTEQIRQRGPADQREQAHFKTVEHPAEQGRGEGHPFTSGPGGRVRFFRHVSSILVQLRG